MVDTYSSYIQSPITSYLTMWGLIYFDYINKVKVTQYQLSYFHIESIAHLKIILNILNL